MAGPLERPPPGAMSAGGAPPAREARAEWRDFAMLLRREP